MICMMHDSETPVSPPFDTPAGGRGGEAFAPHPTATSPLDDEEEVDLKQALMNDPP